VSVSAGRPRTAGTTAIGALMQEGRHALGNGIGGSIVGGIVGVLIAGFAVSAAEPARLELGIVNGDWKLSRIVFENAEYQQLFNAANGRL
jgi:hypothetical protein